MTAGLSYLMGKDATPPWCTSLMSRCRGGRAESMHKEGGHSVLRAAEDQRSDDKSVRALLKTYHERRPIALVIDDRYAQFPYDLASLGVTYAVLGFYMIVQAWGECHDSTCHLNGSLIEYFHPAEVQPDPSSGRNQDFSVPGSFNSPPLPAPYRAQSFSYTRGSQGVTTGRPRRRPPDRGNATGTARGWVPVDENAEAPDRRQNNTPRRSMKRLCASLAWLIWPQQSLEKTRRSLKSLLHQLQKSFFTGISR